MRALVLYDSWFGNTQMAAKSMQEGLREGDGEEVSSRRVNTVPNGEIVEYDVILIGSPNHIGEPSKAVKRQIQRLSTLDLTGKRLGVFDTCFQSQGGLATGKMENLIRNIAPTAEIISPKLSVIVRSWRGPLEEGELIRCHEYGERIAGVLPYPRSELLWDRA